MNTSTITNDQMLEKALDRVDELWGAQVGTPEGQELDALAHAIEAYELGQIGMKRSTEGRIIAQPGLYKAGAKEEVLM